MSLNKKKKKSSDESWIVTIDNSEMAKYVKDFQNIVRKNEPCEPHIFLERNE